MPNVPPVKSGVGQNIAFHASPTARNFVFVLYALQILINFFYNPLPKYDRAMTKSVPCGLMVFIFIFWDSAKF